MDLRRFTELVERHLDLALTEAEQLELESMIQTEPESPAMYWQLAGLHGNLRETQQEQAGRRLARATAAADEAMGAPEPIPFPVSSAADQLRARRAASGAQRMALAIAACLILGLSIVIALRGGGSQTSGPAVALTPSETSIPNQDTVPDLATVPAPLITTERPIAPPAGIQERPLVANARPVGETIEPAPPVALRLDALSPVGAPVTAPVSDRVVARLDKVTPGVEVMRGGVILSAEPEMVLREGDEVICRDIFAGAEVRYPDDRTSIVLAGLTRVVFSMPGNAKRIDLKGGHIVCVADKQPEGRPMMLYTAQARATVVGTAFILKASPARSRLEVSEGLVRFADLKTGVDVATGAGQVAEVGEAIELAVHDLNPKRLESTVRTKVAPRVTALVLLDAVTAQPISGFESLKEGDVIDLSKLATRHLNIQAVTDPEHAGSVIFEFKGVDEQGRRFEPVTTRGNRIGRLAENFWPFYAAGDSPATEELYEWEPLPGVYTLSATPYAERFGHGHSGEARMIQFRVVNQAVVEPTPSGVVGLTLIHAATGRVIAPLREGMAIDPARLGSGYTIRAEVGADVASVKFELDGKSLNTESVPPFYAGGDQENKIATLDIEEGVHVIRATAFDQKNGKGRASAPYEVRIRVIHERKRR